MSCCRVSSQVDPTTQTERAWRNTFVAATLVTAVALAAIALTVQLGLITQIPALNFQITTYSMICGAGALGVLALANLVFTCSLPRTGEAATRSSDGNAETTSPAANNSHQPVESAASSSYASSVGNESFRSAGSDHNAAPRMSSYRDEDALSRLDSQPIIARGRRLARASTAAAPIGKVPRSRADNVNSFTAGSIHSSKKQEKGNRRRVTDWEGSFNSSADASGFARYRLSTDSIQFGESPSAFRRNDDSEFNENRSEFSSLDVDPVDSDDDIFKCSSEEE